MVAEQGLRFLGMVIERKKPTRIRQRKPIYQLSCTRIANSMATKFVASSAMVQTDMMHQAVQAAAVVWMGYLLIDSGNRNMIPTVLVSRNIR